VTVQAGRLVLPDRPGLGVVPRVSGQVEQQRLGG
jgi:hypothetical protein